MSVLSGTQWRSGSRLPSNASTAAGESLLSSFDTLPAAAQPATKPTYEMLMRPAAFGFLLLTDGCFCLLPCALLLCFQPAPPFFQCLVSPVLICCRFDLQF